MADEVISEEVLTELYRACKKLENETVTSTARALWITAAGRAEIRDTPIAAPNHGELLVSAEFSGISRGTEALVFSGRVPAREADRMRAPFQDGAFTFPVKYGYANVARVEHGPRDLQGRLVFVLYPHQTRYVVPEDAARPIPEDVPPPRAVLAANMETAVNAVWDADLHAGQRVSVVGCGVVGCLIAYAARRMAECDVTLVDVNPARAQVASAFGQTFSTPDRAPEADIIFHASATAAGLATALRTTAFEGTIVEVSWYGDRLVPLPLGEDFHSRRLTIKSSQVGHVATSKRATTTFADRLDYALSLLSDDALDVLISGETRFDDLPAALPRILGDGSDVLCERVSYLEARGSRLGARGSGMTDERGAKHEEPKHEEQGTTD